MKIVVDTNVLVSACIGRGAASKVIEACIEGAVMPCLSASLLLEYRDVMGRDAIFKRARLDAAQRLVVLNVFVVRCRMYVVHFKWRPNLGDEGDNHLFELAIAANAHTIVTSNVKDFASPELKFPHIAIQTPDEFIERLVQ